MKATEFLTEKKKKKSKKGRKYYGGYFFPGYAYYGGYSGDGEGGGDGGGESMYEAVSDDNVLFIGNDVVIVGQEHGKKLKLSPKIAKKVKDIAERHGAWYEGNGMDQKLTKGIIDNYEGSWDDDLLSPSIKGYPAPFLYVLFSNIEANDTIEGKIGFDPKSTIFDRILDTQPSTNYFVDREFDAETLQKFFELVSEGPYDFVELSQLPATEKNVRKFFTLGEKLMFPDNWEEYPYRAGRVAKSVNDLRDKFLATRKKGVYVAGSDHLKAVQQFLDNSDLTEMAGEIHGGIRKFLMDKGYKYLGGGIDKQAYLEPNGQVYIVFGYRKGYEDFSPDQRMFINWINYCNKHQDNPSLPKFSAFESFEFRGKKYIQARMETLQELPRSVGSLVGQIDQVTKQIGKGNFKAAYKKIKSYAEFGMWDEGLNEYFEDIQEVINMLGGPERADNLLQTVYEVSKFAKKNNFTVDLHGGNYMQRPDGTIVVNDPFVIWERNL